MTAEQSNDDQLKENIVEKKQQASVSKQENRREMRRAYRQRNKDRRRSMLASMDDETRQAYIEEEKATKARLQDIQSKAQSSGIRIAIDMSFESIMSAKETASLAKQIKYSYGLIRRMEQDPFSLHLTAYHSSIKTQLEKIDAGRWSPNIVTTHAETVDEVFPADTIVYLSPDASEVLTTLDKSHIYVIGGIIDKTRKNFQSLMAASRMKAVTKRLPIQEHISNRTDHILNVNSVIEILGNFQQSNDWKDAIESAMPTRKQSSVGPRARRKRVRQGGGDE